MAKSNLEIKEMARDMRHASHDRLANLFEEMKAEATRIKVIDEILGENTLEGLIPAPFVLPSKTEAARALPLPEKKEDASKVPPNPAAKGVPKKGKAAKRRRSKLKGGMMIGDIVKKVLQLNFGEWLTLKAIAQMAKEAGLGDLNEGSLYTTARKARNEGWIRHRSEGNRSWYSLNPSQGGKATEIQE